MKKTVCMIFLMLLIFALIGCGAKEKKSEETLQQQGTTETTVDEASIDEGMPAGMPPGMGQGSATQRETVVPDSVRKLWVASKILVKKNDDDGDGTIYEMAEGESIQIPDSSLRIEVGHYLPDFSMGPGMITSKSDEPNQPTVKLTVYEDDKEIFSGWAFEKIPEAHAFVHPEYNITLVGGKKAE